MAGKKSGVNIGPLELFTDIVLFSRGPIRKAYNLWGTRYLAFIQRRFDRFSKGGGDWKDLADSTKLARRSPSKKKRGKRSKTKRAVPGNVAILRDTGLLLGSLTPGAEGNLFRRLKDGVRVGFSGRVKHPNGKASYADIAMFHQEGGPNLPKRKIILTIGELPTKLTAKMLDDYKRLVGQAGQIAERRLS